MKKIKLLGAIALGLAVASTTTSCNSTSSNSILNDARVGYQVFVDTFSNGNKKNDGHNTSGDIEGVTAKLDYLKEYLNVDVLWLTPIHRSDSYHGYDVNDYRSVREAFGGMEAYEKLLEEAHKRDIKVMMDLVINHTSKSNRWFMKSAKGDKEYRDYYRWTSKRVTDNRYLQNGSYYYALFWDGMPDLNYDNPKVYDEMLDVCKFWLDKGVDGFRVDGAKHVYNYDTSKGLELYEGSDNLANYNYEKNLEFFKKFNKDIKAYDKDCFLTLEVMDNSASSMYGFYEQGIDSTFDFQTKNNILTGITGSRANRIAKDYKKTLDEFKSLNPNALNSLILSNHDLVRSMNKLAKDMDFAKCAATVQMLLPGLSWIYNGDELGMSGDSIGVNNGDLGYRQPYKWGDEYQTSIIDLGRGATNGYDDFNKSLPSAKEQMKDPNSLLSFYKELTNLKSNVDAFKYGDLNPISSSSNIAAFSRTYKNESYVVIINTSRSKKSLDLKIQDSKLVLKNKNINIKSDSIELDSRGIAVIKGKISE